MGKSVLPIKGEGRTKKKLPVNIHIFSKLNIMANPEHRSILLDHQMIVDGVKMQERKDLTKTLNDETGVEESHLIHTRVIGERSYTAKQSITDGEKEEEMIETDMDDSELENFKNEWEEKDSELENFKNEWEEKWNPSIREDEP